MLLAFLAMFAIAAAADLALDYAEYSTAERTTGMAVRIE